MCLFFSFPFPDLNTLSSPLPSYLSCFPSPCCGSSSPRVSARAGWKGPENKPKERRLGGERSEQKKMSSTTQRKSKRVQEREEKEAAEKLRSTLCAPAFVCFFAYFFPFFLRFLLFCVFFPPKLSSSCHLIIPLVHTHSAEQSRKSKR